MCPPYNFSTKGLSLKDQEGCQRDRAGSNAGNRGIDKSNHTAEQQNERDDPENNVDDQIIDVLLDMKTQNSCNNGHDKHCHTTGCRQNDIKRPSMVSCK